MNGHDNHGHADAEHSEEFELTAAEKEALEKLPRERVPNPMLEDRVIGALRQRGVLAQTRSRVIEITPRRIVAALAACLVLLAGGFVLGQWTGVHREADDQQTAPGIANISLAAQVQQAGSAYVTALERFADQPDSIDGAQAVQGREVALTTLCTAADKVTRLVPNSELAGQLAAVLDTDLPGQTTSAHGENAVYKNRVIEF